MLDFQTRERLDRKYLGGLQVVEALRGGRDVADVLNEIAKGPGGSWSDEYVGAVEAVTTNFERVRNAGLPIAVEDPVANEFLHRTPAAMAGALNRSIGGGDSTRKDLELQLSTLCSVLWRHRDCFIRGERDRIARLAETKSKTAA